MKFLMSTLVVLYLYNHVEAFESCDSRIYCQGRLLDTIQMAKLFPDSKTFVDMSLKYSPEETINNFNNLMEATNNTPTKNSLYDFVEKNFEYGGELIKWVPSDLKTNPKILKKISDLNVREFAKKLISIWPILARKMNSSVAEKPDQHSLISVPNGFIIPGGRLKEMHYWDTYWILKGLIISEMKYTVKGILENFLSLIERYGFIPNGSRVYYLNRSQPPIFALMVGLYIDATNDINWLKHHVDTIEKELTWWWNNRRIEVKLRSNTNKKYEMFRYNVGSDSPRPESYYEDKLTCGKMTDIEKSNCYINLKSGAESGWDFSTRWLFKEDRTISTHLNRIDVTHVIPVDLNAFLCRSFKRLSRFYQMIGNQQKSDFWATRHNDLKDAIQDVLYNVKDGIWYDFDLVGGKQRKAFYPSNYAPLWAETYNASLKKQYGLKASVYFKAKKIQNYAGGIPTSLVKSGQRWDLPNVRLPLQDIIVLGLKKTGVKEAKKIAESEAKETINAYMKSFKKSENTFEKYDAGIHEPASRGAKYAVYAELAWSNGVALHFIEQFYTKPIGRKPKP